MALSPPRQQRIPAWKRIGLKLTHAKDEPDHVPSLHRNPQPSAASPPPALDQADAVVDQVRPQKRRKTSAEPRLDRGSSEDINDSAEGQTQNLNGETPTGIDASALPLPQRRKSVTFTPETKQEDAVTNSAYRQRAAPEQTAQKQISSKRNSTKPQTKKHSTKASSGGPDNQKTPQDTPAFVKYLTHFHTDKSSWKFNKKKQNELFKNLFNLDLLPAERDEAILSYVRGLEGANAIARIRDSSRAVLDELLDKNRAAEGNTNEGPRSETIANMEYGGARLEAYSRALRQSLEQFARAGAQKNEYDDQQYLEMQRETERASRAYSLLSEFLGNGDAIEDHTPSNQDSMRKASKDSHIATDDVVSEEQTHISKRRKRKSRTQDTSHIESDSDSENGTNTHPRKKPLANSTMNQQRPPPPPPPSQLRTGKDLRIDIGHKNASKKIFDDELLDKLFPKPKKLSRNGAETKSGCFPVEAEGFCLRPWYQGG